ncbi:MAG: hypothetical protein HYZ63_03750 [Candidatus Andersenbacteria bacterium]|nr:hypothetical protein [Candidatus Andersenbacteria bacterium]
MSRRLILILLVVLIIGVVGGTAYFVVNRLRSGQTGQETTTEPGSLTQAPTGGQNVANPAGDDDVDTLTNSDEALWGTDPKNPDTDGDGYFDGEEVKANYNPTIPSPNDKLPEGFLPGKDLAPLPPSASEPIAVDQFFQDNLDLTLGTKNYTEAYKSQYGESERNSTTLLAFAKAQPVVTQLPRPAEKSIQVQADDSKAALSTYLSQAGNIGIFSNRPLFTTAINDLFGRRDPSTIQGVAFMVKIYQEDLVQTPVPPSAVPLHQLLLGYTQTMQISLEQMGRYNEDRVRAIVAMKQWEENDKKYVPLIEQEQERLLTVAAQ